MISEILYSVCFNIFLLQDKNSKQLSSLSWEQQSKVWSCCRWSQIVKLHWKSHSSSSSCQLFYFFQTNLRETRQKLNHNDFDVLICSGKDPNVEHHHITRNYCYHTLKFTCWCFFFGLSSNAQKQKANSAQIFAQCHRKLTTFSRMF